MSPGPLGAVAVGPVVVLVGAAAVLGALVGGLVVRERARGRHRVRLEQVAARLGVATGAPSANGDDELAALERHVRAIRAEADAAADARSLLQQALDTLPQAILIMDSSGLVLERNAASEAFVAARHADALVEAAVGELVDSALRGEPSSRTVELFGPPRRVVVITTTPVATGSEPAAVAVVDDITERRRLEAVRTDFVANISHELKTPVGAIGLLAETMQAEDDPAVTARLAERVQAEAVRVGRTIEDLLELSRIELGQLSELEPVAVADVVTEAVARIRPAAEQAGITIDADAVDEGLVVAGEHRQLISALSNLIDNAVKYSDAGGSVEVGASGHHGEVVLTVADHGIGIPARDLERVFERFYRVDQARSRQTGGTGLGLAIVRHVVANHHGSVEVESRLGEGSLFTLRLPVARSTVVAPPEPHDATHPLPERL